MSVSDPFTTTRWWWVRHAPIESLHSGRINGQLDVGIDLGDNARLGALARALPTDAFWVASALSRTGKTAEAIGGRDVAVEAGFNEQHFGDWQGETWDAVSERADAAAFWQSPGTNAPPGGESFADQIARVSAAVGRLSAAHAGRDIVAVVHAGTVRAALAQALGLDPDRALAIEIATLSLTRIDHIAGTGRPRRVGAWRVGAVNRDMG